MDSKKEKPLKQGWSVASLPPVVQVIGFLIVLAAVYTLSLSTDMASVLLLCIVLGGVLHSFGEALPIWNKYLGGGLLMVFFASALLKEFKVLPEKYTVAIREFISGETSFLTFSIVLLITASILSIPPSALVKSTAFFLPTVMGGLLCAGLFGVGAGLVLGRSPLDIVTHYVLPIMGGGNGGGAVPLSQIYEEVTRQPGNSYYGFAIIILTIANLMCILMAAFLNALGEKFPRWTGDKKTLFAHKEVEIESTPSEFTATDIGTALIIALVCYAFGRLFSAKILPTILGVPIHHLAYMILFVVLVAALGLIPDTVRAAADQLRLFMTSNFAPVIMVGMGLEFDLKGLGSVATLPNLLIIFMTVVGATLGSAFVGKLLGLYPIDSAITAGLCMANRGGSGDLAVLGAANRMGLMAFAQLSSNLGGGLVLILASFIFPLVGK